MKNLCLALVLVALTQSCASLFSYTTIDPNRSFMLGEGKHGAYSANITNDSFVEVEVFTIGAEATETSVGVLKTGVQQTFNIPANTAVRFKNASALPAAIKIVLIGDPNLSMGYKDNLSMSYKDNLNTNNKEIK
jgi:hypothetical protein